MGWGRHISWYKGRRTSPAGKNHFFELKIEIPQNIGVGQFGSDSICLRDNDEGKEECAWYIMECWPNEIVHFI
jgi:hypothetical protein